MMLCCSGVLWKPVLVCLLCLLPPLLFAACRPLPVLVMLRLPVPMQWPSLLLLLSDKGGLLQRCWLQLLLLLRQLVLLRQMLLLLLQTLLLHLLLRLLQRQMVLLGLLHWLLPLLLWLVLPWSCLVPLCRWLLELPARLLPLLLGRLGMHALAELPRWPLLLAPKLRLLSLGLLLLLTLWPMLLLMPLELDLQLSSNLQR